MLVVLKIFINFLASLLDYIFVETCAIVFPIIITVILYRLIYVSLLIGISVSGFALTAMIIMKLHGLITAVEDRFTRSSLCFFTIPIMNVIKHYLKIIVFAML